MKRIIATLFATTALAGSAIAADLPSRKAPVAPPPPVLSWTGAYVGANLGGGWLAGNSSNQGGNLLWNTTNNANWYDKNTGNSNAGVIGGVQVGYNYQIMPWAVVGAEADFQGTSIGAGNGTPLYYNTLLVTNQNLGTVAVNNPGASLNWFGTVRGRVGLVALRPDIMIYGTGGFAYANVQRNGYFNQNSATQTGWTAGGGAEWMFNPAWSAKVEYLFTSVSGSNQNYYWNTGASLNNVNNKTQWNTIRAGVNYHFNTGDILKTSF